MLLNNLSTLIETTSLSKEWLIETNAIPIKVALWVIKGNLNVCGIYWKGNSYGCWDDENAVSMTDIILDISHIYRDQKIDKIINKK